MLNQTTSNPAVEAAVTTLSDAEVRALLLVVSLLNNDVATVNDDLKSVFETLSRSFNTKN